MLDMATHTALGDTTATEELDSIASGLLTSLGCKHFEETNLSEKQKVSILIKRELDFSRFYPANFLACWLYDMLVIW